MKILFYFNTTVNKSNSPFQPTTPMVYERTSAVSAPSANSSASRSGNGQRPVSDSRELTNTIDMINMIIEADTTAEQAVPRYGRFLSRYSWFLQRNRYTFVIFFRN